ncbi:MAG: YicC/YloC family endoribonuclease [Gammaproteobacteria bacterium]
MIRSMTAFAREERGGDWGQITWEIRSVNHRFLEVSVRMPEELRGLEMKVREQVQRRLKRGKVELGLRFRAAETGGNQVSLDREQAQRMLALCDEMATMMEASKPLSPVDILRLPGVMREAETDMDAARNATLDGLGAALDSLVESREREGARLRDMLVERVEAMKPLVLKVRERMPRVLDEIRERLRTRLAEIDENLDTGRIEQEMVILTQKLDVDEELDRLGSHIQELGEALDRKEPVGRRLDFLMQEFNREANTLASKSADKDVSNAAIELKVLIEQMREQVQNIE